MKLQARMEKLERRLASDTCVLCGADLQAIARRDEERRPRAQALWEQCLQAGMSEAETTQALANHAPSHARSLGIALPVEGFCRQCGTDRRSDDQRRAHYQDLLTGAIARGVKQGLSRAEVIQAIRVTYAPRWKGRLIGKVWEQQYG